MSDFLEAVARLLERAPAQAEPTAPADTNGSFLMPPMAALAVSSRSFEAVCGGAGLLERLAEEAEASGDTALADLLRALDREMASGALRPPASPGAVRRFTGFVYPVV